MAQAQSPGQALQLLADYGLIYSPEYKEALALAVEDWGVPIPALMAANKAFKPKLARQLAAGLLRISKFREPKLTKFSNDVLARLAQVINASGDSPNIRIQSLMVSRFVTALAKTENPQIATTLNLAIRIALLNSARSLLVSTQNDLSALDRLLPHPRVLGYVLTSFMGYALGMSLGISVGTLAGDIQYGANAAHHVHAINMLVRDFMLGFSALGLSVVPIYQTAWYLRSHRATRLPPNPKVRMAFDNGRRQLFIPGFNQPNVDTLSSLVVSIQQVWAGRVSPFSPVQLNYFGQLDLQEIHDLASEIGTKLQQVSPAIPLAEIRELAEKIRKSPDSEYVRYLLAEKVTETKADLQLSSVSLRSQISKLIAKIEKVKVQLRDLRDMMPAPTTQDYLQVRADLLLARIADILEALDTVEVHEKAILDRFDQWNAFLESQYQSMPAFDASPTMWREAASQVLLLLESAER